LIYWILAVGCGYAIGSFMRPSWRQYALCVPASALLYFLVNLVVPRQVEDSDVPYIFLFLSGVLVQSLVLMLGVFLARRKSKRNSFEA